MQKDKRHESIVIVSRKNQKIQKLEEVKMTQGDELREKLENVLAIIRESENNFWQRTSLEAQIRKQAQEKVELSFDGKKGRQS